MGHPRRRVKQRLAEWWAGLGWRWFLSWTRSRLDRCSPRPLPTWSICFSTPGPCVFYQLLYPECPLTHSKKVKSLNCVQLFATPWTVAYQAPLSMGFSRQEYWSGVPLPSPREWLPLQYSHLENSTDRGASLATVHGITKSWTWLSDFHQVTQELN